MKLSWYRAQMQRPLFQKNGFWIALKGMTYLMAAGYALTLLLLAVGESRERLAAAAGIPALVFLLVTALRRGLNRPRPFAVLGIEPLRPHEAGISCPSRHTASAVVLFWVTLLLPFPARIFLAAGMGALAVLIGVSRVYTGMHFLRDVLLGAAIATAFGALIVPGMLFGLL